MECKTIHCIDQKGIAHFRDKKKYKTRKEAKIDAEKLNNLDKVFSEKVVYKCKQCKCFHVGSSTKSLGKELRTDKVFGKIIVPKVVGSIDLSVFKPKKEPTEKLAFNYKSRKTFKKIYFGEKKEVIIRSNKEIENIHLKFLIKYNLLTLINNHATKKNQRKENR